VSIWESEAGMSEVYGRFFGTDACWLADGRGISRFDPGRMALAVLSFDYCTRRAGVGDTGSTDYSRAAC
jgi:hypothetical protein